MKVLPLILLFCASAAFADTEYFDKPPKGSVYHMGDTIEFLVDKSDDDVDKMISANLYRHIPKTITLKLLLGKREDDEEDDDDEEEEDDESDEVEEKEDAFSNLVLVKTIHQWLGSEISNDDSDFFFQWKVENVIEGDYHVQMDVSRIKMQPGLYGEEYEEEEEEDNEKVRSHTFKIINDTSVLKQTSRRLREKWYI